jgi:hypothetical protein
VLPTGGCACHSSGLSVQSFLRGIHIVEYSDSALAEVAHHVVALANAEDLPAHGEAVTIRFPHEKPQAAAATAAAHVDVPASEYPEFDAAAFHAPEPDSAAFNEAAFNDAVADDAGFDEPPFNGDVFHDYRAAVPERPEPQETQQ